jgi:LysR family cys regulon transcriptional activator
MTLTQLRYFAAIVESGFNISRAAQVLHTSQPGVSRQIRVLEEQLGTNLLERTGGRIVGLTETGTRVLVTARRILKDADSLKSMSDEFLQQEVGQLTIATMHTHAHAVLPKAVAALRRRYPGVVVEIRQASPSLILDLARAGEVDLGLTIEIPAASHRLAAFPLMQIPRILIVPRNHPLLKKRSVTLQDLTLYPMICQHALSAGGWAVTRVFKEHGVDMTPAIYAMDASVIKAHVEEDAGIAVISGVLFDPKRDSRIRAINVSHIFEPSTMTAVVDPYRYLRGYTYDFIAQLAPDWTRQAIDDAIRKVVFSTDPES